MEFDLSEAAEAMDFTPIKPGTHEVQVTGVKQEQQDAGRWFVELEFTLESGRKFWQRFYMQHPKQQTRAIAKRQIMTFFRLAGMNENDAQNSANHENLLGHRFTVVTQNRTYEGSVFTGLKSIVETGGKAPAKQTGAPAKPAAAAANPSPW